MRSEIELYSESWALGLKLHLVKSLLFPKLQLYFGLLLGHMRVMAPNEETWLLIRKKLEVFS